MVSFYTVIVCSKCRRPKVTDVHNKWTKCPSCGKRLETRRMRHFGTADDPVDLIQIVGDLNRKQGEALTTYRNLEMNEFTLDTDTNNQTSIRTNRKVAKEAEEKDQDKKEAEEKDQEKKEVEEKKQEKKEAEEKEQDTIEVEENELEIDKQNDKQYSQKAKDYLQDIDPIIKKGKDRMSQLREGMILMSEFTVEEYTELFISCGGKADKAVDSLRGFMSSGEVYSPRRGFFRYVP